RDSSQDDYCDNRDSSHLPPVRLPPGRRGWRDRFPIRRRLGGGHEGAFACYKNHIVAKSSVYHHRPRSSASTRSRGVASTFRLPDRLPGQPAYFPIALRHRKGKCPPFQAGVRGQATAKRVLRRVMGRISALQKSLRTRLEGLTNHYIRVAIHSYEN